MSNAKGNMSSEYQKQELSHKQFSSSLTMKSKKKAVKRRNRLSSYNSLILISFDQPYYHMVPSLHPLMQEGFNETIGFRLE